MHLASSLQKNERGKRDTTLSITSQPYIAFGLAEFEGSAPMQGKTKERWIQLCEQAAFEQDPKRLVELVEEIDKMLGEKEQRLQSQKQESNK